MPDASGKESSTSALIGKVVRERYRVLKLLGEGGMGGVYECEHVEIGKHVAVKFVSALHAQSPQIAARLKREARSTGALESEHIVQVFDAGEDPEHGLFLVMELLRGRDLGALLETQKRLNVVDAVTIVNQAAIGLEKAHEAGIIHRDLKPANMFVCQKDDGRVDIKLVDFGIAKLVRDANEEAIQNPGLTRAGSVIGTPQYMSPEQAQGLASLDLRTDVYSLAAVLCEMITGEPPHPSLPTYEQTILRIVINDAPRMSTRVPSVPRDLDDLVASMLSRDPNARPPHMRAVRAALARIFPEIEHRRLTLSQLQSPIVDGAAPLPIAATALAVNTSAVGSGTPGAPNAYAAALTPGTVMMAPGPQRASAASWPGPLTPQQPSQYSQQPSQQQPSTFGSRSPQQISPHISPPTSAGVSMEYEPPKKSNGALIVGLVGVIALVVGGTGAWFAIQHAKDNAAATASSGLAQIVSAPPESASTAPSARPQDSVAANASSAPSAMTDPPPASVLGKGPRPGAFTKPGKNPGQAPGQPGPGQPGVGQPGPGPGPQGKVPAPPNSGGNEHQVGGTGLVDKF